MKNRTLGQSSTLQSRRPRLIWAVISVITLMVLLGCSLLSNVTAPSNLVATEAGKVESTIVGGLSGTPASAGTPVVLKPTIQLPLSVHYADAKITLTDAEITDQMPDFTLINQPSPLYAVLTFQLVNPNSYSVRFNNAVLSLKLKTSDPINKNIDQYLNAQDSEKLTEVFNLPNGATWDGASLSLAEEGKEPALMSLDGPTAPTGFPVEIKAGQQASVNTPSLTYKVKSGTVDLDGRGVRADKGNEYLTLVVDATCTGIASCYVGPESFRVIEGDTPQAALYLDPAAIAVGKDTTQSITLNFQIPANSQQVTFQVGESSKDTVKITLDLSPSSN